MPARSIEQAARWYGAGPSLLWIGQGFQRQPRGGNAVRAVAQLAALSGNLGRPGTGVLYLNGTDSRMLDADYVCSAGVRRQGPEPISHMDLAGCLESADDSRALVCWNLSAQVKATEPTGQSLPNSEIFRRLAAAMGMPDGELYEADAEVIAHLLRGTGLGLDFAELARRGTVWAHPQPRIQFEALRFPTPTGRIELASDRAQNDGHPRVAQPLADVRPTGGRLRLLTPASSWMLNHSFANEPKIARRVGVATVALHPLDAAERGLGQGDRAVLRSRAGELELSVLLSQSLPRGVAFSPKGRWPGLEAQPCTGSK